MNGPGTTATGLDVAVERARTASATQVQEFGNFFLGRFLDLDVSYDDPAQTCSVVLPYAQFLCNPQGSVHGGVIATAMDISMGHLCHRFLCTAVTIEMQLRYFRALTGTGYVTGRLLRPGRRIVHLESRLTDEQDRLVAFATGSWHRLDAV